MEQDYEAPIETVRLKGAYSDSELYTGRKLEELSNGCAMSNCQLVGSNGPPTIFNRRLALITYPAQNKPIVSGPDVRLVSNISTEIQQSAGREEQRVVNTN